MIEGDWPDCASWQSVQNFLRLINCQLGRFEQFCGFIIFGNIYKAENFILSIPELFVFYFKEIIKEGVALAIV